ncbi:TetR/AcrR family transcriptional regulator [Phytoactinopolyspora limicola]|uniref:TetR/AcrR family transcriptional regulator n=1 Tax=Phytoactinopolyspora limicola TaxID=2715536 RepID=UPI00140A3279|nr:TetR/AcrR family transcriptional regulator [Phytoactinopolyspora limicola]
MSDEITGPRSGYASPMTELLGLRTTPPKERADAARNRAAVLDAAARLFAAEGVDAVSMDAIAAAAGVGKGTLFRRFTDKSGLAVALLDERERDLQERILFGPEPLGPGPAQAPPTPVDRLMAFVDAYLDYALDHLDLLRMSETASAGARYRIGAYRFWHRHVAILLAGIRPKRDAEAHAHVVLAALAGEHLHATVAELGTQRVRSATKDVLRSWC